MFLLFPSFFYLFIIFFLATSISSEIAKKRGNRYFQLTGNFHSVYLFYNNRFTTAKSQRLSEFFVNDVYKQLMSLLVSRLS